MKLTCPECGSWNIGLFGFCFNWRNHKKRPDYKRFAKWCLEEGPWDGCDLDGGDVQAAALECGIIHQVPFNPEVHGGPYDDWTEPGDPWFELVEP